MGERDIFFLTGKTEHLEEQTMPVKMKNLNSRLDKIDDRVIQLMALDLNKLSRMQNGEIKRCLFKMRFLVKHGTFNINIYYSSFLKIPPK